MDKKYTGREMLGKIPWLNRAQISETINRLKPNVNPMYRIDEAGFGHLFADVYVDVARYIGEHKAWYIYKDGKWTRDVDNLIVDLLLEDFVDLLDEYSTQIKDPTSREIYTKQVARMRKRAPRDNMLKDAKKHHPIAERLLDVDRLLFNCQNGTLCLKTGELFEHNPADLISRVSGTPYNPMARSERWIKFIYEIMEGDEEKIRLLQQVLGYALSGDVKYECFIILYGQTTRNGTWACSFCSRFLS